MAITKHAIKSISVANGYGHDYIWEQARGDWRGYHRCTIKAEGRLKSPTFRGINQKEVHAKISAWLQSGGLASAAAAKRPKLEAFTVGDLLQGWFDSKKWSAKNRTCNGYRWDKHVKSDKTFWTKPLEEFKVKDALGFLQRIAGSENTKKKVLDIVRPGFGFATRRYPELCPTNPFSQLEPDEIPVKSKSRMRAFSIEHEQSWMHTIVADDFDPFWRALILFMFDAGAEPQEFLAIQWRDIDWSGGTVHLQRTADQIGAEVIIKDTMKAKKRNRKIPLTQRTLLAIRALWSNTAAPNAHVFSRDGLVWGYGRFFPSWVRIVRCSKLPYYAPLCLRHTMATRLLSAGAPLTAVSARLGHENYQTTLTHYAHAVPEDADVLATFIEARFAALLGVPNVPKSSQEGSLFGPILARELSSIN